MRTKSLKRKLSNILLLGILLIIAVGIYFNIYNSRAENVIEIGAIAHDNYGYLESEEFKLEANKLEGDLYEIELPESINSKKVFETSEVTLEDTKLEVTDNKIQLTQEQLENGKINIEVKYDVAILGKDEQGQYSKELLSKKTEEERNALQITEETEVVYYKILKYEDEGNGKLVELKGFLPKDAELKVVPATEEQLKEIFGDAKIDVAYDITILIPTPKEDGTIEYKEVNPEEFGEMCQVTIKDTNIVKDSQVYHVKDDNTIEEVLVTESEDESISFDAQTFSLYAVASADEGIMTAASTTFSWSRCTLSPSPYEDTSTWISNRNQKINLTMPHTYADFTIKYRWKNNTDSSLNTALTTLTDYGPDGSDIMYSIPNPGEGDWSLLLQYVASNYTSPYDGNCTYKFDWTGPMHRNYISRSNFNKTCGYSDWTKSNRRRICFGNLDK